MLFSLALGSGNVQAENKGVEMKVYGGEKIVALGDSLTEGYGVREEESYPALLQKRLNEDGYDCTVINAGISGELSIGAAGRLGGILQTLKPDIVILETGVNDAFYGIDLQQTEAVIDGMLQRLAAAGVTVLLAGMKMVWDYGADSADTFNAIYPRLAAKYNVVLMPFFLEGVALQPQLNLDDELHPNRQGYQVITETIYPYVRTAIERHRQQ